jgi:hypothetical protein
MYHNRIKEHRTVLASTLVPHPLNWRRHPQRQRKLLRAVLDEVGFARSLTAYEDPDTKQLVLIDGHLRVELDPRAEVVVEVLDVTPEEARTLLFALDPIASLASSDAPSRDELFASLEAQNRALAEVLADLQPSPPPAPVDKPEEKYYVLVKCASEEEQRQLLERFLDEGLDCRALLA